MSIQERNDKYTLFSFDHNQKYRNMHQIFLDSTLSFSQAQVAAPGPIQDLLHNINVDELLEKADLCFLIENYDLANDILELCISCMQYAAHPCFNLTSRSTRLEYKYLENRPYHVALLKYAHMLSNRACHRTALEICKVLLNLDPDDPLAVLLIVDTFAVRARQHQWLHSAVDHWNVSRGCVDMFNMQYSQALAGFHLANKKKDLSVEEADRLLSSAMRRYPFLVVKMLEACSHKIPVEIRNCVLFNKFADDTSSSPMKELMKLYAKFTWSRWREPTVLEWFIRNAKTVAVTYDNSDANEKEQIRIAALRQRSILSFWPREIIRHLCIIKPMSAFLVNDSVPEVPPGRAADPLSSSYINRYGYQLQREVDGSLFFQFLRAWLPYD